MSTLLLAGSALAVLAVLVGLLQHWVARATCHCYRCNPHEPRTAATPRPPP